MKDFLGNEIRVGDIIVYPGRQSSSLWMNKATVTEVTERQTYSGPVPVVKAHRHASPTRDWTRAGDVVLTVLSNIVVVAARPR